MDVDLLISLVEERPVLWDKTLDVYKNKAETKKCWEEICRILKSDYSNFGEKEKYTFYKEVVKKWSNIRDSFCKSKKKIKENKKSGSGCVEIKKYIYHDQLQFLNKTIYRRDTPSFPEESQNSDENDDEEIVDRKMERVDIVKQERKRRHSEEFEENMPEILEVQPNRHLSFFQGIIPTLNNFNDDEIVEFQLGVLQLIKKIKQQNTHNFSTVHFLSTQP